MNSSRSRLIRLRSPVVSFSRANLPTLYFPQPFPLSFPSVIFPCAFLTPFALSSPRISLPPLPPLSLLSLILYLRSTLALLILFLPSHDCAILAQFLYRAFGEFF